jgi:hypothetical protein
VTTLPKMITAARDVSRNNLLFYLIFSLFALPKKSAFGKVSCMEKHRLLPQMTASLYLGQTYGVIYDEGEVIKRGTYASTAQRAGP